MTHEPSDGPTARIPDDGIFGRREQRVALLARASQAVRRARDAAGQSEIARAVAEEMLLAAIENKALRAAEREALRDLENDVRQLASLLRQDGMPPEVAVRRLKATVEPVVFSMREIDGADIEWRRTVAVDVVRWFVESYYAA